MLDHGTNPPDPFLDPRAGTAAIIVVQNVYPYEQAPSMGDHVAVRVVGNSARIIANALPPEAAARLAATAPMPLPVAGQPVTFVPKSDGGPYRPHWTVQAFGQ